VQYGWSRNVLMNMMMNKSMERTGAAPSNFVQHLDAPDTELAQQVAKDPCSFEFLGLCGEVAERDLEQALMDRITDTLREMGPGFAFVAARSTSTSASTTSTSTCSSSTSNSSALTAPRTFWSAARKG
jgi:predicted nuclease of restriction endonuclease-like (RecB) superfamily